MKPGALSLEPNLVTAGVGLAVLAGLFCWWLIRKKRKRLWLPTLRLIELESRRLPKLRITPPPLIAFICFTLAALAYWFFASRPSSVVSVPSEPRQNKIHILADMSPSVAARTSLETYAAKVGALVATLGVEGRVTLSTSHSLEVIETNEPGSAEKRIRSLGFHRAGLKLGELVRKQIEHIGDVERLLIVSDADRFSWGDFNWRFLEDEMDVLFVPVADGLDRPVANAFIDKASYQPTPDQNQMSWEIEIARTVMEGDSGGVLKATLGEKLLATAPWSIGHGRSRVTVSIAWPVSSAAGEANDTPLTWRLETPAGNELKEDDTFRTLMHGLKQDLLIINEPRGEMFLDDPSQHLEIVLETLGFKVKRLDRTPKETDELFAFPVWIIMGGTGAPIGDFCPAALETQRLANATAQIGNTPQRQLPKVWLAPADTSASYRDICWCFARLTVSKQANEPLPAFCEDVQTRDQWIGVLASLGAKQVGGDLGNHDQSLAWLLKSQGSRPEVLAFTVPLKPGTPGGLTFTGLPLLVRSLLTWQGLIEPSSQLKTAEWPRIPDITSYIDRETVDKRISLSNVPGGESMLYPLNASALPPTWSSQLDNAAKDMPSKRDQQDPQPWLEVAAMVVIVACGSEALLKGLMALWTLARRKRFAGLVLACLVPSIFNPSAEARVPLTILSTDTTAERATNLAREVQARTSIDLAADVTRQRDIDDALLLNPWLFAGNPSFVADSTGRLDPRLVSWIKRGGFLIIENAMNEDVLTRLTEKGLVPMQEMEGWQVVPPDHELMRSFHLLDSLPVCQGQVWRGFHYDGRLAVLAIPFSFLDTLLDRRRPSPCVPFDGHERAVRAFINLLMVALATDYKKDQIHLPEILKRLR